MTQAAPPLIFSARRRLALRRRMQALQTHANAPRYLIADMVEDVVERLGFLRVLPARALVVGDGTGALAAHLEAGGTEVIRANPAPAPGETPLAEELPYPVGGFDVIASLGTLDTVNDLPGALIHLRQALAPGGLLIASFMGAGSLPMLRAAMLEADGDRPAPRLHPMVDVRAGGQLLQRAGFAEPVADARGLDVRFGSLASLLADLRAQGLTNVLANPGPVLGKAALARLQAAYARAADAQGRVTEHFEILTLSAWRK